jgi:hypothetical protein
MIITPEQASPKAQQQFDAQRQFVDRAAQDGQRIDAVERELFQQLLGLGHSLLSACVAQQGDGDLGPEAETPDGHVARRLPERHDRRYVSIFGEMTIARVAYGSRDGQRIERESEKGSSPISILRKEKESREHIRKCLLQAASRLRKRYSVMTE